MTDFADMTLRQIAHAIRDNTQRDPLAPIILPMADIIARQIIGPLSQLPPIVAQAALMIAIIATLKVDPSIWLDAQAASPNTEVVM